MGCAQMTFTLTDEVCNMGTSTKEVTAKEVTKKDKAVAKEMRKQAPFAAGGGGAACAGLWLGLRKTTDQDGKRPMASMGMGGDSK
jgi:hypothetical protein